MNLYTETLPLHTITVTRHNGQIERILTLSPTLPDYFHCFNHQWSSVHISKVDRNRTSARRRIVPSQLNAIRTSHDILLQSETPITCTETGIVMSLRLSAGLGANLPWVSPLTNADTCLSLLREAQRHGVYPHQRFSRNILSGMLISIARSKRLLRIKNPPLANTYLQSASGTVLGSALQSLMEINSVIGLPSLSLLDPELANINGWRDQTLGENRGKSNADITLLNWMKAIREARTWKAGTQDHRARKARGIKVYTSKLLQQVAEIKREKSLLNKHLESLMSRYDGGMARSTLISIAFKIKNMEFMSQEKRIGLVRVLESTFKDDPDAIMLASLIKGTETDAIESGLESFTDSNLEKTETQKGVKVDFMAMIRAKQNK